MAIKYQALPTLEVRQLQAGGLDAYGNAAEQKISDGSNIPCRHCLKKVAAGDAYLVLAYRPFQDVQPYAETGPIFLHAKECERAEDGSSHPEILSSPTYIVRAYCSDERIIYGTGDVVSREKIEARAANLLTDPKVAFVHVRSAQNNCFQCRVERSE